jgi:lambda repressor-like predicted transcriptional regulator
VALFNYKEGDMIRSNVKDSMEKAGVSVRGLVAMTGLADGTVQRARDDRIGSCSLNTLATIAAALGVRTKNLFEED